MKNRFVLLIVVIVMRRIVKGVLIAKGRIWMNKVRIFGFIEVLNEFRPIDQIVSCSSDPFADIEETFEKMGINHYLVTYEEVKDE